ncbi:MAG: hypothetical protein ACJA2X_001031 [Halocynthiibacter sp.]
MDFSGAQIGRFWAEYTKNFCFLVNDDEIRKERFGAGLAGSLLKIKGKF